MLPVLIMIPGIFITVYVLVKYICPTTNRFFAMIWNERNEQSAETVERIKELYVDGDIPEETALLMASVESGLTPEQILRAFGVADAKDLAKMIRKNPGNVLNIIQKMMDDGYKKGMK